MQHREDVRVSALEGWVREVCSLKRSTIISAAGRTTFYKEHLKVVFLHQVINP